MCKGKKWKTYLFKVTGSTYLHYFDENKVTERVSMCVLHSRMLSVHVNLF